MADDAGIEKPLLLDVPERILTDRLELRAVSSGVGERVNEAICESHAELAKWMAWATPCPKPADTEEWCRSAQAKFINREAFNYHFYLRGTDTFVGSIGMFGFRWDVPKLEVGYWIRTSQCGKGYTTEAVHAATRLALDSFHAQRIQIRCDDRNVRSARVAELAGYTHEATLRRVERAPDKSLRDERIYVLLRE